MLRGAVAGRLQARQAWEASEVMQFHLYRALVVLHLQVEAMEGTEDGIVAVLPQAFPVVTPVAQAVVLGAGHLLAEMVRKGR